MFIRIALVFVTILIGSAFTAHVRLNAQAETMALTRAHISSSPAQTQAVQQIQVQMRGVEENSSHMTQELGEVKVSLANNNKLLREILGSIKK